MNARDFIRAIKIGVADGAAKATMDAIREPAGRRPDPKLVRLSQWFSGLTPENRNNVAQIAELAADQATYNFLLTLDGLLTLEPAGPKGELELLYVKGDMRTRLNSGEAEELSSLFKAPP